MIAALLLIATVASLRVGSAFLIPIVIAGMLSLLLAPPLRWLMRRGIGPPIAAAILVLMLVGATFGGVALLVRPATEWISRAPATIAEVDRKVRRLMRPLGRLQETAKKVDEVTGNGAGAPAPTAAAPAGIFQRLSMGTAGFLGASLTVVFLSYFLLAMGKRFEAKLEELLPERVRRQAIDGLREMETQMSGYLWQTTLINIGVGMVTWGVLALLGMPSPLFWGVVCAVLNYIPYLGGVVSFVLLAMAALVSFDTTQRPLMVMGAFLVINTIEANLVVPMLLGKRLPLNPVAIFLGLLFWGWIWGITGAILAVPLTVMIKVVADRVKPMRPLGVMLDN